MKTIFTLPYLTLLCLAVLMVSCSKEIETTDVHTPNVTLESTERNCITGCNQCSQDFCCCRIDILQPTGPPTIQIQLCGALPGCISIDTCSVSAVGNCPEIRGVLVEENLSQGISFLYCHEKEGAILIRNLEPFPIQLRITCMISDLTSMFTDVSIPEFGSQTVFVDSECEPDECN